jgi:phospholipase C
MTDSSRRRFLRLAGGAGLAGTAMAALPGVIRAALATEPARVSGTLADVQHVVILMQENRSFDHYFGTLRGVRGFGDGKAWRQPDGRSVFEQSGLGDGQTVLPFHLDTVRTGAAHMHDLDHSWKGAHADWKHYDRWVHKKSPLTMGYFTREDLPFYYALADAFTICDAYHCSLFGPTNPNRLFLFSGTSGLHVGQPGIYTVNNADDGNWTSDSSRDKPDFDALRWTTYAQRLQQAGIDWKVYQEYDNYGDNTMQSFAAFRGLSPDDPLHQRCRAYAEGSNAEQARTTRGEAVLAQLRRDVQAGTLPQVSWLMAPYAMCEHPDAPPGYGEAFSAQVLEILASNPQVWSRTVFFINYDENDGFFDHMPPPLPALDTSQGGGNVAIDGEDWQGTPFGLGARVPMLVVSPWSRGGWVNSQVFDHTSVIRFLEQRFGVHEPNIGAWRRAVCGDLTSTLDFSRGDRSPLAPLAGSGDGLARTDASRGLPAPEVPARHAMPRQEAGRRPARALPYALEIDPQWRQDTLRLRFHNTGAAGAVFMVRADGRSDGPWHYTVRAGSTLDAQWPHAAFPQGLSVHGPNGFFRHYRGDAGASSLSARLLASTGGDSTVLEIANSAAQARSLVVRDRLAKAEYIIEIAAHQRRQLPLDLAPHAHWYDLRLHHPVTDAALLILMGHMENGQPSWSDPAIAAG